MDCPDNSYNFSNPNRDTEHSAGKNNGFYTSGFRSPGQDHKGYGSSSRFVEFHCCISNWLFYIPTIFVRMDMSLIDFSDSTFYQLSLDDWYDISRLRERIFIVEQKCPYLDADGKDQRANHIIGRDMAGALKAYARIVHPEDQVVPVSKLSYFSSQQMENLLLKIHQRASNLFMPAIGRVVLDESLRGQSLGDALMRYTMSCYPLIYGESPVFISAQEPLHDFYVRHGFVQSGPGYLEDDIPHVPMVFAIDL